VSKELANINHENTFRVKKLDFNYIITRTTFDSNLFSWKSYESFRTTFGANWTWTCWLHQI